jgi:hypothetical protein
VSGSSYFAGFNHNCSNNSLPRARTMPPLSVNVVLRGLDPRIHVFASVAAKRGWPGQARPKRL